MRRRAFLRFGISRYLASSSAWHWWGRRGRQLLHRALLLCLVPRLRRRHTRRRRRILFFYGSSRRGSCGARRFRFRWRSLRRRRWSSRIHSLGRWRSRCQRRRHRWRRRHCWRRRHRWRRRYRLLSLRCRRRCCHFFIVLFGVFVVGSHEAV